MKPMLLSVIVPVYNVEKYLACCVESILCQTYKDLEIILVDDGSPDGCGAMCDAYAKKDGRVRVIHKENGGLSDARNAGLSVCRGDYIGFVDSDDTIAPDMYETLVGFAEKENLDVAMCGVTDIWPDREEGTPIFAPVVLTKTEDIIEEILVNRHGGTAVPVWCRIYRAPLFKDLLFEKGRYYEDGYYLLPWIVRTRRFGRLSERKYFYFHREGSITDIVRPGKRVDDFREAYEAVLRYIQIHFPQSVFAGEYRLWLTYGMILHKLGGRDMPYCRELAKCIRMDLGKIWKNPYVKTKGRMAYSLIAWDVKRYYQIRAAYQWVKRKLRK